MHSVYLDCDRDSIIYLSTPQGPSCHTGAQNCWFSEIALANDKVVECGTHHDLAHAPRSTLQALEWTIEQRRLEATSEAALAQGPCLCTPAKASTSRAALMFINTMAVVHVRCFQQCALPIGRCRNR